jgi:hypothetical protein
VIGLVHGAISHPKLAAIIGLAALFGWAVLPLHAGDTCAGDKFEVNGHPICVVEGAHANKAQYDEVMSFADGS